MISDRFALLGLVVLAGCVDRVDGTWAQINVVDGSDTPAAFVHEEVTLGIAHVELMKCPTLASRAGDWLGDALLPSAYAHSWDRSVAVGAREESMPAGAPERTLTVLSPAAGTYCAVRIGLAATRYAASSIAVKGTFEGRPISMSTDLHLDLESTLDPPLTFDLDALDAQITFIVRPSRWLDGVTAEALEARGDDVEIAFVRNVAASTSIDVRR